MERRTPMRIATALLMLCFAAYGCKNVPTAADKLDEGPQSITVVSGGESQADTTNIATDSTIYDFNDLAWNCSNNNQFSETYKDLQFEVAPRWAVCDANSGTEGQDGMALLPADLRLHHNNNNGTSELEDTRIILPQTVDSVSLNTANYDRRRENFVVVGEYRSWLVAYDSLGNEIDRAVNKKGNFIGVDLMVRAAPDTMIHTIGVETYTKSTYLDNLKTWVTATPPPDTTAAHISYTAENDTLTHLDRKMVPAVSGISAEDDRGGPVTLVISVSSNQEVIEPGDPTAPDWEFIDNGDGSVDVMVRAEYSGKENDRIYTISMQSEDEAGNLSERIHKVVVPRKSD
ncbi:MAG: hypothetical protein R3224_08765 [Balneolaceae bacterium]|nr:hypothetical protein [Balneolaceae bacterium]